MINSDVLCKHLKATFGPSYQYWFARLTSEIRLLGLEQALEDQKAREQFIKNAILTGKTEFGLIGSRKVITHYENGKPVRKRVPKSKPLARLLKTALLCYGSNDFQSQHAKKVFRFIKTSNIYRFKRVTPTQFQKAKDDINTPLTEEQQVAVQDIIIETKRSLEEERQYLFDNVHALEFENPQFVPSMVQFSLNEKRAPVLNKSGKTVQTRSNLSPKTRDILTMLRWCRTNKVPFSRAKVYAHGLFNISLEESTYRALKPLPINIMGRISFIQEPKGKLRVVANPFLFLQVLQEGDKIRYRQVLKMLPEVYTFNQELGVFRAIEAMQGGTNTLFCYDCTAFTDRFSIEYQIAVSGFSTQLLYTISKGKWVVKQRGSPPQYWTYAAGQPMGLGPSFFLATFAHWCLLATISKRYGYKPLKSRLPFGINGDDVWISDHRIASDYHRIMEGIGVEINLKKSIISNTAGEFLGQIFNHKGSRVPSIKYRSALSSFPALVNAVKYYGKGYLNLLEKNGIKTALSILPIELGGCNLKLHSIADSIAILSVQIKSMLDKVELYRRNFGSLKLHTLLDAIFEYREYNQSLHTKFNTIISENDDGLRSSNRFSISVDFYVNHDNVIANAYKRINGDKPITSKHSFAMDRGIIRSLYMDTIKRVQQDLIAIRDLVESIGDYSDFINFYSLYKEVENDFTLMQSKIQEYITRDLPDLGMLDNGDVILTDKPDEKKVNRDAMQKAMQFAEVKLKTLNRLPGSIVKEPMAIVKVEKIVTSSRVDQIKDEDAKDLAKRLDQSIKQTPQLTYDEKMVWLNDITSRIKTTKTNIESLDKMAEQINRRNDELLSKLLGENYDRIERLSTGNSECCREPCKGNSGTKFFNSVGEPKTEQCEEREETPLSGNDRFSEGNDSGSPQVDEGKTNIKRRR